MSCRIAEKKEQRNFWFQSVGFLWSISVSVLFWNGTWIKNLSQLFSSDWHHVIYKSIGSPLYLRQFIIEFRKRSKHMKKTPEGHSIDVTITYQHCKFNHIITANGSSREWRKHPDPDIRRICCSVCNIRTFLSITISLHTEFKSDPAFF